MPCVTVTPGVIPTWQISQTDRSYFSYTGLFVSMKTCPRIGTSEFLGFWFSSKSRSEQTLP